jgi:hypothetical protein
VGGQDAYTEEGSCIQERCISSTYTALVPVRKEEDMGEEEEEEGPTEPASGAGNTGGFDTEGATLGGGGVGGVGAGVGVVDAAAATAFGAVFSTEVSMLKRAIPTGTSSPAFALTDVMTPAIGDRTSTLTLSVSRMATLGGGLGFRVSVQGGGWRVQGAGVGLGFRIRVRV